MAQKQYKYRKICHTDCYKFSTLWLIGDIYEGDEDPGKHFSDDGLPPDDIPATAGPDDPRSTNELIKELKTKFGVTMTKARGRKVIWAKLKDLEDKAAKDAQTEELAPEPEIKVTPAVKRPPRKGKKTRSK